MAGTQKYAEEETFRDYNANQAKQYSEGRPGYNPALFDYVFNHHESTGGGSSLVVDLGTGHGNVIRSFAPRFDHAIGVDPSAGMLGEAERLTTESGIKTRSGERICYVTGAAEQVDRLEGVGEGQLDLLVAGTAAHWFDMPRFWPAAARALRSGGSVAFWVQTKLHAHPLQPHRAELQALLDDFEEKIDPWMLPGNHIVRDGYGSLAGPAQLSADNPGPAAFPESGFHRKDWNREGECEEDEDFFASVRNMTPARIGLALETASPVTRWRADEAIHRDIKAGRTKDCVEELVESLEAIVGKDGNIKGGLWTALLLFKRA